MSLSLELASRRYQQQARWTQHLRRHLFSRYGLPNAERVLEIGCGSGAILRTIDSPASLFGIDIDLAALRLAGVGAPRRHLTAADGHQLPYASASFDVAFFHFVLLWLVAPEKALREAARVTRRGGAVIAFAEPDYGQRIDKPESLASAGRLQTEALRAQGANPEMGSQLPELFQGAGLTVIESGQLQQDESENPELDELELEVLRADLAGFLPEDQLNALLAEERRVRPAGQRFLHVPTFYALGKVD